MKGFLNKVIGEKKKYREMVARVKALPHDYRYVYEKIQNYMWHFAAGDGYDLMDLQAELLELFEAGAASGRPVLEITGEDVAGFADALLLHARTYTQKWREKLNRDVKRVCGRNPGETR